MALYEGFLGPSYAAESQAAACDDTVNYIFEALEIPHNSKTSAVLYQRPGSIPFGPNPNPNTGVGRALMASDQNNTPNGAIFGVSGEVFWQMNNDGSLTNIGIVAVDSRQARIVSNSASVGQIAVASGGELYILHSGIFTHIPNDGVNFFGARDICFIDGYFLVLSNTPNSQQFQISAINDGLTWDAADVALLEGQADPIERCIVNIEYVYFIGLRRGEVWYNSGNQLFPFTIQPGAFLEIGTNAPDSVVQSAGGGAGRIYWTGQDARGENIAVVAQGLSVEIISQPAVSAAWSSYSTTDDCICYPYTWNGHSLIRYIFPTADIGWEYDITESGRVGFPVWNKVTFTDVNGVQHAPYERVHAYGLFGKHIVISGGIDGTSGQVYELDAGTYTDCANNWTAPFDTSQEGRLFADITNADTTFNLSVSNITASTPFYLIAGGGLPGGEIMLCTSYTAIPISSAIITVTRGLGGSTAQAWTADTALQVVTFPGFAITRDRITRLPFNGNLRNVIDRLEFMVNSGNGNEIDPGLDPVLLLSIAVEFGPNGPLWGPEIQIPMGRLGQYGLRVLANRLGYYRDGAIRVRITEPVFAALAGAQHYIRPGIA